LHSYPAQKFPKDPKGCEGKHDVKEELRREVLRGELDCRAAQVVKWIENVHGTPLSIKFGSSVSQTAHAYRQLS
jgi:hypothetical protein